MKRVIVVHGVGGGMAGHVASTVARTLGFARARVSTVWLEGQPFVEIVDEVRQCAVLEVNWSDIRPRRKTLAGVVAYTADIVTSMLDVAAAKAPLLVPLYRIVLFTINPGALLLSLTSATAFVVGENNLRRLLLVLALLASSFVAFYVQRFGRYFVWLWPWVGLVGLVVFMGWNECLPSEGWLPKAFRFARMLSFLGVLLTLVGSVVEMVGRLRQEPISVRATYLALLYAPYIALNGLISWVTFLAFSFFAQFPARYSDLERLATPSGLSQFERAATYVYGGLAVASLLAPAVPYWLAPTDAPSSRASPLNRKGHAAQSGLLSVLILAPIPLLVLLVEVGKILATRIPSEANVLDVYRLSVLRTLPLVFWSAPAFAVVLRIVGDVLFYVQRNEKHPASIGEECRRRLKVALHYARANPADSLVVIAHSQGTVIAADVRREKGEAFPLLTLGSPITSLYARFLGIKYVPDETDRGAWINAYAGGDYIAGPISSNDADDELIGPGGHTGYWEDRRVKALVDRLQV